MPQKTVKTIKKILFFYCAHNSQDFAQGQESFAQAHDCETVTLRNSGWNMLEYTGIGWKKLRHAGIGWNRLK